MANATANRDRYVIGKEGRDVHLPVAATTHLYAQTMVVQIAATGVVAPVGTGSSTAVIGVAQHEVDNTGVAGAKRVAVETDREFVFDNDGTNAVSEAIPFGTALYAVDDHTVGTSAGGGAFAGTFHGMEPNGKVRVMISNQNVFLAAALAS